jgi:hypothetical protein
MVSPFTSTAPASSTPPSHSEVEAADLAATADTVQFCFSKGLGAPVGSIVCGPSDLMAEVRYRRKRLGGGMRQAGVIAAAARVALAERSRLVEDHELAAQLARELAQRWPGTVDPERVDTNIVPVAVAALPSPVDQIRERLAAVGWSPQAPPPGGGGWSPIATSTGPTSIACWRESRAETSSDSLPAVPAQPSFT